MVEGSVSALAPTLHAIASTSTPRCCLPSALMVLPPLLTITVPSQQLLSLPSVFIPTIPAIDTAEYQPALSDMRWMAQNFSIKCILGLSIRPNLTFWGSIFLQIFNLSLLKICKANGRFSYNSETRTPSSFQIYCLVPILSKLGLWQNFKIFSTIYGLSLLTFYQKKFFNPST